MPYSTEKSSINPSPNNPFFSITVVKKPFENILGKGKNAGNLFPQYFLFDQGQLPPFQSFITCCLQMLLI